MQQLNLYSKHITTEWIISVSTNQFEKSCTYCLKESKSWTMVLSTSSQQPVKLMVLIEFWWWAMYSILPLVTQWQSFHRLKNNSSPRIFMLTFDLICLFEFIVKTEDTVNSNVSGLFGNPRSSLLLGFICTIYMFHPMLKKSWWAK